MDIIKIRNISTKSADIIVESWISFLILLSCYCFQIILTLFHEMLNHRHCVKNVRMPNFSGWYFSAFGLNTERYGVSLHIQSKCGKIQTRKTPNTDFSCSDTLNYFLTVLLNMQLCRISSFKSTQLLPKPKKGISKLKSPLWLCKTFLTSPHVHKHVSTLKLSPSSNDLI